MTSIFWLNGETFFLILNEHEGGNALIDQRERDDGDSLIEAFYLIFIIFWHLGVSRLFTFFSAIQWPQRVTFLVMMDFFQSLKTFSASSILSSVLKFIEDCG